MGKAFVIAILIAAQVLDRGTLHYELGGWPVPFGIGLAIGPLSALMLLVITGSSLLALLWGPSSMDSEVGPEHQSLLYASWLLALCGLAGIAVTNDAFNIFVFMEISALAVPTQIFWHQFQSLWLMPAAAMITCFILRFAGLDSGLNLRTCVLLFLVRRPPTPAPTSSPRRFARRRRMDGNERDGWRLRQQVGEPDGDARRPEREDVRSMRPGERRCGQHQRRHGL
jgi:NADH:ubiquinone oxidoreductase subunit K